VREDIWGKRFVEDALPEGLTIIRLLTVKSNLVPISALAERGKARVFLVLATMKGYLVELAFPREGLTAFAGELSKLEMVFDLAGSIAEAAGDVPATG
jgi:hypothetical protein